MQPIRAQRRGAMPHRAVRTWGLAAALLAGPWSAGAPAQRPQGEEGAYRGYVAVRRLADGTTEIVDQSNADRLFVPASVLKLVTASAVLEHLGGDYRWVTRLTSAGTLANGILGGDLVIEPAADPTWHDDEDSEGHADALMDSLAGQVRAQGVARVRGDLVVDLRAFPGRRHPVDRAFGDLPYRLGTPPAALAVDEATITVRVAPGASVGEPARVSAPDGIDVLNQTLTVGPERNGAGTLDFLPWWGTDTLQLRGEYPIGEDAFVVPASDPSPEGRAAERLRAALVRAGVTVDGGVRLETGPGRAAGGVLTLAELRSPPLSEVLERMLVDSDNWYADMLVLTLAHEVNGSGRFDDGVEVVADFAHQVLGGAGLSIEDGSGLSGANLITPRAVAGLLVHALTRPWGETLLGAMARPGTGTLDAWPGLPPLTAKTGTLNHTVGLAGVFEPTPQGTLVFCYFVNHYPDGLTAPRREIVAALKRWQSAAH